MDVEDTKAGKYERGRLLITTLRVIWMSFQASNINLCIGLHTIQKLDVSNKIRSGMARLHQAQGAHFLSVVLLPLELKFFFQIKYICGLHVSVHCCLFVYPNIKFLSRGLVRLVSM
jgi:hypothetical protein